MIPDTDSIRPSELLAQRVRAARDARRPAAVSLEPASAYEAVTRQLAEDLQRELTTLRTRVDQLLSIVVASVLVDALLRIAGV